MVYIAEAHAMDEWPVRSGRFNDGRGPVLVEKQPKGTEERCSLARQFMRDFQMVESTSLEVVVDDPELGDPFETAYAPWPLRLYLVRNGILKWIAEPKNCSYDDAVQELVSLLGLN